MFRHRSRTLVGLSWGRAPGLAALFSLPLAIGCAARVDFPHTAHAPVQPERAASGGLPALSGSTGAQLVREAPRRVGDRMVHRFSGTYRQEAMLLLEEVVAAEGDVLVVDYRVLEGDAPLHLRVRMARRSERILRVSQLMGGSEVAATLTDYQSLMEKTSFAPDSNHGLLAHQRGTCLLGVQEFDCITNQFAVEVAGKPATLLVSRHPGLARDVAGELRAVDGTVLYKADLVELERGPTGVSSETSLALGERVDEASDP